MFVTGPGGPGRSFRDMLACAFSPICQLGGGPLYVFEIDILCANGWGSQVSRHTWDPSIS